MALINKTGDLEKQFERLHLQVNQSNNTMEKSKMLKNDRQSENLLLQQSNPVGIKKTFYG